MSEHPDVRLISRRPDGYVSPFHEDLLEHELVVGDQKLVLLGMTGKADKGGWGYAFASGRRPQGAMASREKALARLISHTLSHLDATVRRAEKRREAVREALTAVGLLEAGV